MAEWRLDTVEFAIWRGLLFVAIDPGISLEAQLGALVDEIAQEPMETYTWMHEERLIFDANWKIYTDNFVEGYHIPGIHPAFHQAIEFESFETVALDGMVRMTAPPKDGLFYRGKWLWMWPNWTLSLFEGGMNTSRINPIDHRRTELIYNFYFADTAPEQSAAREKTIADNLAVIREDFEVCVETQKNYESGGYRPGPLSPRHEQGVAYFQAEAAGGLGAHSAVSPPVRQRTVSCSCWLTLRHWVFGAAWCHHGIRPLPDVATVLLAGSGCRVFDSAPFAGPLSVWD